MDADELVASLRIHHNGLTLRPAVDEDDVDALMPVYSHDFDLSSSTGSPLADGDTIREQMLKRIRRHRRFDSADNWCLELVVEAEPGAVLGWATLSVDDPSRALKLETTSWVAEPFRRQGHATSIREATLGLAFVGLGADVALSRVQRSNTHSTHICERLGYANVGFSRTEDPQITFEHWELTLQKWQEVERRMQLHGCDELRAWLNSEQPARSGRPARA